MTIDTTALAAAMLGQGLRILLVVALGWALYGLLRRLVPRVVGAAMKDESFAYPESAAQRRETLTNVMVRTGEWTIIIVAAFTVLAQIGINIAPILAGAGIAGVAIGLGSQGLVKDMLSGIFILFEDQYRKGDDIKIASITGTVEDVNLRRTVLRDVDGTVHIIPNGQITTVSNMTRDWALVNLDVGVTYGTDLDRAREVINQVGQEMAQDPYFGTLITEPPHFECVEAFEKSTVTIKILGTTRPNRQREVMGDLRQRLLKAFDENGIDLSGAS